MNKKEIQGFIAWYLPAVLLQYGVSGALAFSDGGFVDYGSRMNFFVSHLSALICGGWLFMNSPKHGLHRWLWAAFGLGAHLFAILLFFGCTAWNGLPSPDARETHDR